MDMASDIEHQTISSSMMEFGLSFDRKFYKANREVSHIFIFYLILFTEIPVYNANS